MFSMMNDDSIILKSDINSLNEINVSLTIIKKAIITSIYLAYILSIRKYDKKIKSSFGGCLRG